MALPEYDFRSTDSMVKSENEWMTSRAVDARLCPKVAIFVIQLLAFGCIQEVQNSKERWKVRTFVEGAKLSPVHQRLHDLTVSIWLFKSREPTDLKGIRTRERRQISASQSGVPSV